MIKPKIILVGAGGHCRSCIDVIEQEGRFDILGVVDQDVSGKPSDILGYPILCSDDELPALKADCEHALVAVGQIKSVEARYRIFIQLKNLGYTLPTIISPRAYLSRHAQIGEGTIVMHDVVVNANARVGVNGILNTRCLIEHDAVIGDHVHVSTGAIVNGASSVGDYSFVGSGSIIVHGAEVAERGFIRANNLVVSAKDCNNMLDND
jgi:sugar O-acyltransferase (sialic acid O-acetyltransferase NeuD family)